MVKIKKNTLYTVGTILIVLIGVFFLFPGSGKVTGQVVNAGNGDVQIVKLHVENGNYVLEPSELKKDARVRLEADLSRMPGCSKSIVISAFGVSKTFTSSSNFVEFVPNKAGTFNIACSMNMYKGTFTVLESDGSKASYVEQQGASGGSCGGGGGGCGCGG
ncbi:cupredoxin domain-containing protein [Candidatus Pacearchaeota archaeon]|nr:cupredoxin domain-containing protein [Candidatus Pacearchaeota archaeon]